MLKDKGLGSIANGIVAEPKQPMKAMHKWIIRNKNSHKAIVSNLKSSVVVQVEKDKPKKE